MGRYMDHEQGRLFLLEMASILDGMAYRSSSSRERLWELGGTTDSLQRRPTSTSVSSTSTLSPRPGTSAGPWFSRGSTSTRSASPYPSAGPSWCGSMGSMPTS